MEIYLTCDCKVNLTHQDIYEIGIRPILEDISAAITTSLVQKQWFGNYGVSHLFVIGKTIIGCFSEEKTQHHPSSCEDNMVSQCLRIYLMQSLEVKELAIPCTVLLSKTLEELTRPMVGQSHVFFNNLIARSLQQVASEDYIIEFNVFGELWERPGKISYRENGVGSAIIVDPGKYDFILRKGEPLTQEISRTYHICLEENEELYYLCK